MSRDWRLFLSDMIEFCETVVAFTEGFDQKRFEADRLVYDATLRNIELIGEAATHIPEAICLSTPHIQWRQIVATRNRLIHGYLGIDKDVLWSIIQDDIPKLLGDLRTLEKSTGAA